MVISNNLEAGNANRMYNINRKKTKKSQEKLASGKFFKRFCGCPFTGNLIVVESFYAMY